MNIAMVRVVEKTLDAMIGVNPKHYLGTHLGTIKENLSRWEGVNTSPKTISRCLHYLDKNGRFEVEAKPICNKRKEWVGKRLIIKATSAVYAYARITLHAIGRFLFPAERTSLSVDPKALRRILSQNFASLKEKPKKGEDLILWDGKMIPYPVFRKEVYPNL